MRELKSFIYLDKAGIDSLLAQINKELVYEQHAQRTNRFQGTAEGHAGLPQAVKGILHAEFDGSAEYETIKTTAKTSLFPHEARIPELISILESNHQLLTDSKQIQQKVNNETCYFLYSNLKLNTYFDCLNWVAAIEDAKRVGFITLFIPTDKYAAKNSSNYIDNDSYYKRAKNDIYISMDLGIQHMLQFGGFTSHLATFFRATKGKDMPLGVFGRVLKLTDEFYQIKPYAVWRI